MMAGMEGKGKEQPDLAALVMARFEQSMSVPEAFFASEAGRIAEEGGYSLSVTEPGRPMPSMCQSSSCTR